MARAEERVPGIQGAPGLGASYALVTKATEGAEIPGPQKAQKAQITLGLAAMKQLSRRQVLELAATVAALPIGINAQTPAPASTLRFFPGFQSKRVKTSGAEINLVHAGSGPPLLLLHGAPQTHVSMRLIAPELAKDYTVVVPICAVMA